MHHIHHTEGIILGSKNFGETGKYYILFTRDLGLVYASASGVRKMASKLRYILQDFSYIKVDLVQGKDFWRITSASKTNKLDGFSVKKDNFFVLANVCRLLKRLLIGTLQNKHLFDDLLNGLYILEKQENKEELKNIEMVMVLRVLDNLGYIGERKEIEHLIKSPFDQELVFQVEESRKSVLSEINRALRESQL